MQEMNNFHSYITPEKAHAMDPKTPLSHYVEAARDKRKCQCGEPVWRYAGTGLCFTCTTGESDASGDYELEQSRGEK